MAINPISSAIPGSIQGPRTSSAPGATGRNFEMLMKAVGAGDTTGMQKVIDALKQGPTSTEGAGKAGKMPSQQQAVGGQRAAATQGTDIMNAAITPKTPLGQRINTTA